MRVFDFTLDGETIKLGVPNEETMEQHIEEGTEWLEKNKVDTIPAREWTKRRRRFLAQCMNLAEGSDKHTAESVGQNYDTGFLNAASNVLYEKCGIKVTQAGEAKAAD